MWGPKVFLKAPEDFNELELSFLTELMDLEEKGRFFHDLEDIRTINQSFEISRKEARGGVETFMASIMLINEEIKPKYFKPIIQEFIERFKNIEDVLNGMDLRTNKDTYSEEKAREVREFFYSFYMDLPEETVLIDKNVRIMIFGLHEAGKTTLVNRLEGALLSRKYNRNVTAKKLFFHNLTMTTYDLPVKDMFGKLWNHYIRTQDGFIFVIDASNQEQLEDAIAELHKIGRVVEEQGDPLLILFNKMDQLDTPREKLLERIHLKVKPHHCFFTSLLNNEQVFESFEWLANKILRNILRDKDWNV